MDKTITTESYSAARPGASSSLAMKLMGYFVTLSVPVLLVMVSVRVVMTPLFLQFEYSRIDFPPDFYGFTTEDRLQYAPYALQYLLNGEEINFLGDLRFPDGGDLYNARELRHMRDVKTVTQVVFLASAVIALLAIISLYLLIRHSPSHASVSLVRGSILSISLVVAIVIIAVLSWNTFFTGFHSLFFSSGTWQFEYSDTLIRLFPEQFWFDAAVVIGVLTVAGACLLWCIAHRMVRRYHPH